MKTAIVPIIEIKTGNSSDKNNYRPIDLVTACSKIIELYLDTHGNQFGFKKNNIRQTCVYLR